MTSELEPLRLEAMESLAQTIGDYFTGSEINRLFQRSGCSHIKHDGGTKWRFVAGAFQQLQHEGNGSPNAILQVVKTACHPQGWIGKREQYDIFLEQINSVMEFYALKIDEEGKLRRIGQQATTVRTRKTPEEEAFDGRGYHAQVVRHSRAHFVRGAHFHAVFEACKAFDEAVRINTGVGKSGQPLMSEAFCLNGAIKLNAQKSQSEKDEQQGVMYLCMGIMSAIRNPQSHEPELSWSMSREDALDVLGFLSYLFRKLESALVIKSGMNSASQIVL